MVGPDAIAGYTGAAINHDLKGHRHSPWNVWKTYPYRFASPNTRLVLPEYRRCHRRPFS